MLILSLTQDDANVYTDLILVNVSKRNKTICIYWFFKQTTAFETMSSTYKNQGMEKHIHQQTISILGVIWMKFWPSFPNE